MKEDIILIGAGGHCSVIVDIINASDKYNIVGVCAYNLKVGEKFKDNIYCLGDDRELQKLYKSGIRNVAICIGAIGAMQKRVKIYNELLNIGFKLPVLIHPSAIISQNTIIGEGTCIMPMVVVNSGTKVGVLNILNTASIIEHDCIIGNNSHISPRACLCGGVSIGKDTHIGAGAIVNQGLQIGNNVIVGSGAVVTKNIGNNKKVMGIPAK